MVRVYKKLLPDGEFLVLVFVVFFILKLPIKTMTKCLTE